MNTFCFRMLYLKFATVVHQYDCHSKHWTIESIWLIELTHTLRCGQFGRTNIDISRTRVPNMGIISSTKQFRTKQETLVQGH